MFKTIIHALGIDVLKHVHRPTSLRSRTFAADGTELYMCALPVKWLKLQV